MVGHYFLRCALLYFLNFFAVNMYCLNYQENYKASLLKKNLSLILSYTTLILLAL